MTRSTSRRRGAAKTKTAGRPRSLNNSLNNSNDSDSDENVIEASNKSLPARRSQSDTNHGRSKEPIQVVDISLSDDEEDAPNDSAKPDPVADQEDAQEASDSDSDTIIGEQLSITSENIKAQKRSRPKSVPETPSRSQPQPKRRKLSSSFDEAKEDSSDDDGNMEVEVPAAGSESPVKRPGPRSRTLVPAVVENLPSTSSVETDEAEPIIQDLKICDPSCECPPSTTWYKCNKCPRISTSKASIIQHKKEAHNQRVDEDEEEEFSSD